MSDDDDDVWNATPKTHAHTHRHTNISAHYYMLNHELNECIVSYIYRV